MTGLLPGTPASALMVRGYAFEVAAFLCVVPIALESYLPGPWWAWGGGFLGVATVLLAIGIRLAFASASRSRAERAAGYTTVWKVAVEDLALVYVDGRDGRVVAGADQPRPASGRRADIEAAKARHSTAG